jgi:hypothetical protein
VEKQVHLSDSNMGKQPSVSANGHKTAKKAHYPSSKFDVQCVKRFGDQYGLRDTLQEIAQSEASALASVFTERGSSSSSSKDVINKQALHAVLLDILTKLPNAVAEGLDGQESGFNAELSLEERDEIRRKQKRLNRLQQHADKIASYSSDLSLLRKEFGLWLGEVPTVKVTYLSS